MKKKIITSIVPFFKVKIATNQCTITLAVALWLKARENESYWFFCWFFYTEIKIKSR